MDTVKFFLLVEKIEPLHIPGDMARIRRQVRAGEDVALREIGDEVAVLHSGLSDGERYDAWRRLRAG